MTEARDFLVVYEEPADDLNPEDPLDIEVGLDQIDLAQEAEVEFGATVGNERSSIAVIGLVLAILGALAMLAATVVFLTTYPDSWWPESDQAFDPPGEGNQFNVGEALTRTMSLLLVIGAAGLVIGNLLVGFSRRLRAQGVLHAIRFRPAERR